MVTLMMAAIIGILLASYLTLVSNQNRSVLSSQAWNTAIPVAEAGIEEALTQIQYNGINNLSADGWTASGNGWYYKQRYVDNTSYYQVNIQQADPPVIVSTGYVPRPQTVCSQLGMILATLDSGTSTTPAYTLRRVRVQTSGGAAIHAGMLAKGQIDFKGNNVTVDSFDSGDPMHSSSGKYDASIAKDNGDVETNSQLPGAINMGNGDIKGHVATGPGGTVAVGSNGSVGDNAWVNAGTPGIETGWNANDMNVDIQDVQQPFTNNYSMPGGARLKGGIHYDYLLGTGNYKLSSFGGKVLVNGDAVLWVTDSVSFGTGDFLEIAPGASLKLYVSAPTATFGGLGILNDGGYAKSFQYYGMPANTSVNLSANVSYAGVIYAPEADFTLGGGGSIDYDFVGASVTSTVKLNGHFHVHYDEALRKLLSSGYLVIAWSETDPRASIY